MTVEQRLERLERQNKRLKGCLCAVVVAGLAALTIGATSGPRDVEFGTVKAKKVLVMHENEDVGVALATDPELGGVMFTNSSAGKRVVSISSNRNGNGVILTNSSAGKVLVRISSNENGNGTISTLSPAGKALVSIGSAEGGNGGILTFDSSGKELILIGSLKETGEGSIAAYSRAGNVRALWPLK